MRSIQLPLTINDPSDITPTTGGLYKWVVVAKKLDDTDLNHPRIPNSQTLYVALDGNKIILNVLNTLADTDAVQGYFVVYRDNLGDCCEKVFEFNITSKDGGGTGPNVFITEPKLYLNLQTINGLYSDNFIGDYEQGGVTYRQENGRTYRVFYWLNEVPYANEIGGVLYPKSFKNVPIRNGLFPTIRKVYYAISLQGNYTGTSGPNSFIDMKNTAWQTSWTNPESDFGGILKTVSAVFSTGGNGINLMEGDIPMKKNPSWLATNKLIPQFYGNLKTVRDTLKPTTLQCWPTEMGYNSQSAPKNETFRKLKEAGVDNLWYVPFVSAQNGNIPGPATNVHGIVPSHQIGTQSLGDMFPSRFPNGPHQGEQLSLSEANTFADSWPLYDYMVITDEMAEGSYPQFEASRTNVYNRFKWRIDNEINPATGNNYVGIQLLGEYGYGSTRLSFTRLGNPSDTPMSLYYRQMTGDRSTILANIEQLPSSNWTVYRNYLLGDYSVRGVCVGAYYAISHSDYGVNIGRYITEIFYNAIVQNNAAPLQPKGMFTSTIMQSNDTSIDIPQKDSGTILPLTNNNGEIQGSNKINYNYPGIPAELLKIQFFFSKLFYNSVYWWDAWGTKELDEKQWYEHNIRLDSAMVGNEWYASIEQKLEDNNYTIVVCDYIISGTPVISTTTERNITISMKPDVYVNNIYFNERAEYKQGSLLAIPNVTGPPTFIWINPFIGPNVVEQLSTVWSGTTYNLGEVPGMTLMVTNN